MTEQEIRCAWCNETVVPVVQSSSSPQGSVTERKCPRCNKLLSAYLAEKDDVLKSVRSFHG